MFNPRLTKESGLARIGEPERSAKFSIVPYEELFGLRKNIVTMMDFGVKAGLDIEDLYGAKDLDRRYMQLILSLQVRFNRLLKEKINLHAKPFSEVAIQEGDNLCMVDCKIFREALINVIDHANCRHLPTEDEFIANYFHSAGNPDSLTLEQKEAVTKEARSDYAGSTKEDLLIPKTSTPMVEAYSSSRGVLWTVEQEFAGEKFLAKAEPIVKSYSSMNFGSTYVNEYSRKRGCGFTIMFDPARKDQICYEFLPPEGLRVVILKLFTGDPHHDVELF